MSLESESIRPLSSHTEIGRDEDNANTNTNTNNDPSRRVGILPSAPLSTGSISTSNERKKVQQRKGTKGLSNETSLPTTIGVSSSQSQRKERRERRKQQQQQQQQLRSTTDNTVSKSSGGSVLWTVLVIGIVFCLIDVAYIIRLVEKMPHEGLASATDAIESGGIHSANHRILPLPIQPSLGKNAAGSGGNQLSRQQLLHDKERILQLLEEAGVTVDVEEDAEMIQELPTWTQVVSLYGEEPVIHGLEQCEIFQKRSDAAEHFVSTAGTFNSGTNLMAELLIHNCHMQARMDKYGAENRGVRWQVPWYVPYFLPCTDCCLVLSLDSWFLILLSFLILILIPRLALFQLPKNNLKNRGVKKGANIHLPGMKNFDKPIRHIMMPTLMPTIYCQQLPFVIPWFGCNRCAGMNMPPIGITTRIIVPTLIPMRWTYPRRFDIPNSLVTMNRSYIYGMIITVNICRHHFQD